MKLTTRIAPIAVLVVSQWGCNDVPDEAAQSPQTQALYTRLQKAACSIRSSISPAGVQSATPTGTVDQSNPYFQSLGTNGRTCNSCHQAGEGWTVTPFGVTVRFLLTQGNDPIFRPP